MSSGGSQSEKLWVYLLAGAQFTHMLDFLVLIPLSPRLHQAFAMSGSHFGLLLAAQTFSACASALLYALCADRFDRKHALMGGLATLLLASLAGALLPTTFPVLLGARLLAGAGGGVVNGVVFALVADLVPRERRGWAYGAVVGSFALAGAVGVPLALALAEWFGWTAPFLLVAWLCGCALVETDRALPFAGNRLGPRPIGEVLRAFCSTAIARAHAWGFLLSTASTFAMLLVFPLLGAAMVRNAGLAPTAVGHLHLAAGGLAWLACWGAGRLSDRHGPFLAFTSLVALSLFSVLAVTNLGPTHFTVVFLCTAAFMASGSGRFVPAMSLLAQAVSPERRGSFMGLESALRQLASGTASLLAGYLLVDGAEGRLEGFGTVGLLSCSLILLAWICAWRLNKVMAHA